MKTLILIGIVTSFAANAKVLELKKNTGTIFIEENKSWTLGKDLFGIPFMLFSPQTNGQRSNISFTNTGANIELEFKTLSETQEDFKKNKKQWAEKIGADILSFEPYGMSVNNNGHKVHSIGVSYVHEGKSYLEKSNYIECKGRLIYSKSLRLKQNDSHDKDFKQFIQSLDCGGV